MDSIIEYMDDFIIHATPLPRRFPSRMTVGNIGYISRKDGWLQTTFNTFNYSFILSGSGTYRMDNRVWPVRSPCVITQWPGVYLEYGPDQLWEELYLVYPATVLKEFQQAKLADRRRPVWYMQSAGPSRRIIQELLALADDSNAYGQVDQIDRTCERMVLQSYISRVRTGENPNDRIIREIRAHTESHYHEDIDFDTLAGFYGMSPATFRRHWGRIVRIPPAQYQMQLRIRQACRLLAETRLGIGEIARSLGYDDPLYFSRRFHKTIGQTASEYRHLNSPEQG